MTIRTDSDKPVSRSAYSIDEAMASLGISRPTIYKLIREGRLRTVTVGARRLVPATAIDELLADVGPER